MKIYSLYSIPHVESSEYIFMAKSFVLDEKTAFKFLLIAMISMTNGSTLKQGSQ